MKHTTDEFILFIDGPTRITEEMESALFDAGCSDGILGKQNGALFMDFSREAPSFLDAVTSAKMQIERAIPKARVSGIKPSPF